MKVALVTQAVNVKEFCPAYFTGFEFHKNVIKKPHSTLNVFGNVYYYSIENHY